MKSRRLSSKKKLISKRLKLMLRIKFRKKNSEKLSKQQQLMQISQKKSVLLSLLQNELLQKSRSLLQKSRKKRMLKNMQSSSKQM